MMYGGWLMSKDFNSRKYPKSLSKCLEQSHQYYKPTRLTKSKNRRNTKKQRYANTVRNHFYNPF